MGAPRGSTLEGEDSTAAPVLPPLSDEVRAHVGDSYPHNHDYRVRRGRLRPGFQLWVRWRRIRALWPARMPSFLDVGASKGFFVLEAAARPECERALGIDVHAPDVEASRSVAAHLGRDAARFELVPLHELAERIDEFGGPFDTVHLINVYPYLLYGGRRSDLAYGSHERLAELLARVTASRLVFSNVVRGDKLPRHMRERVRALADPAPYDERAITDALAAHFHVESHGRLGRRPLLLCRRIAGGASRG